MLEAEDGRQAQAAVTGHLTGTTSIDRGVYSTRVNCSAGALWATTSDIESGTEATETARNHSSS